MMTFADTSGLYALIDAENVAHEVAASGWAELRRTDDEIVTTNYVVVETVSLLQSRFSLDRVRDFTDIIDPLLTVEWVDGQTHGAAVAAVLVANRRDLSLVDCVSFGVMRRLGIRRAFTLDEHFREQGFDVIP